MFISCGQSAVLDLHNCSFMPCLLQVRRAGGIMSLCRPSVVFVQCDVCGT